MSFFRSLWGGSNSKHQKLCEEWGLANSCESVDPSTSSGSCSTTSASTSSATSASSSSRSGLEDAPENNTSETVFEIKYLGSTLVESPNSEKETADAIKSTLSMAKASGKKLPRVSLAISLEGIRMMNLDTEEEMLRVSIYSISYCSADGRHGQVFAFISSNLNETLECHAFMCPKRKVAQTIAITVSKAFNSAYELWQLSEVQSKMAQVESGPEAIKLTDDEEDETDKEDTKEERYEKNVCRESKRKSKKNLHLDLSESKKIEAKVESWKNNHITCIDINDHGLDTKRNLMTFDENHFNPECSVSFEDETEANRDQQGAEGGILMKPLKSPTSPTTSISLDDNSSNNNDASPSTTPTKQLTNSWQRTESRALDVVCSS